MPLAFLAIAAFDSVVARNWIYRGYPLRVWYRHAAQRPFGFDHRRREVPPGPLVYVAVAGASGGPRNPTRHNKRVERNSRPRFSFRLFGLHIIVSGFRAAVAHPQRSVKSQLEVPWQSPHGASRSS